MSKKKLPAKELYRLKRYGVYKTYTNLRSAKSNMDDEDELFIYELKGSNTKKAFERERSLSAIIEGFPNKYQIKSLELLQKVSTNFGASEKNIISKIKTSDELHKSLISWKDQLLREHCSTVEDYESMLYSHNFRNIPKEYKYEYELDGEIYKRWVQNGVLNKIEIKIDDFKYDNFKQAKKNIKKFKEDNK